MQGQQVAQRVHGEVQQLAAARVLVPVPPGAMPALRRAVQRPTVQHRRGRLLGATGGQAQDGAQVVGQDLEAARPEPTLGLIVNRVPLSAPLTSLRGIAARWRQVVRHRPPSSAEPMIRSAGREPRGRLPRGNTVPHDVAQAVEGLPQRVLTLARVLGQQGQVGHHQRPFFVGHVGRVRLARGHHARKLGTAARSVHNSLSLPTNERADLREHARKSISTRYS